MIRDHWRRCAGLHIAESGSIAAVWLAHDRDADVVHIYDACVFAREVLAVVAEGLNARGRWLPVAWVKDAKDIADKLLERGCNMSPDPAADSDAAAEAISRDLWERMRTGRLKVDKRLAEWLDEFRSFRRQDNKVPRLTHPLMAATRHAIELLPYARAPRPLTGAGKSYPKVAIV